MGIAWTSLATADSDSGYQLRVVTYFSVVDYEGFTIWNTFLISIYKFINIRVNNTYYFTNVFFCF